MSWSFLKRRRLHNPARFKFTVATKTSQTNLRKYTKSGLFVVRLSDAGPKTANKLKDFKEKQTELRAQHCQIQIFRGGLDFLRRDYFGEVWTVSSFLPLAVYYMNF